MADNPWAGMTEAERKKRAARHCGGGLDMGSRVIKKAPGKPKKKNSK